MKYKNLTEMERTELTNATKKPSNEELDVTDIIASEFLNNIKNEMCIVTYENINCLIYTSAVALKQHLNDVFLKVDENNEKAKEPKWMSHLTNKINRLRRDTAHTDLTIKCKASNNFTNHHISHIETP